jgi:SAM-dependent methyltransferase
LADEAVREHWNGRYLALGVAPATRPGVPPPEFAHLEDHFPEHGDALELACGRGRGAVWLAGRGLRYQGVDLSPVAVDLARGLLSGYPFAHRCRFDVWDLDGGLPDGPPADVILAYWFHDRRLDSQIVGRLAPGGLLAVAVQSEVGVGPGEFRAPPGMLRESYEALEMIDEGEADGTAWLLGRRPT